MPNPIYALILAGGSGERFWPLSRRACPKQLLRLVSDKTLLEETLGRLEGVVPPDHTLILTNTDQESAVRKLLGGFAKEKFSLERGHVRLVSAHSAPRIQPSRSRARRFHFPTSRSEKLRECFARPLQQTAANLIRLCHHGKGGPRSRSGGKFRLGRHRKLESIGELF